MFISSTLPKQIKFHCSQVMNMVLQKEEVIAWINFKRLVLK